MVLVFTPQCKSFALGFWLSAFGLWLLAVGFWPLAFGPWLLAFGVWLLAVGVWPLAFGVWPLVFGLWRLAFGRWPLAFGFWPLTFGLSPGVKTSAPSKTCRSRHSSMLLSSSPICSARGRERSADTACRRAGLPRDTPGSPPSSCWEGSRFRRRAASRRAWRRPRPRAGG